MSRLIVKNLPNGVSENNNVSWHPLLHSTSVHVVTCVQMKEERFRAMFSAFGTVTDCSLKFTKEGKFRKFGFVGFKTEDDAGKALKHFHRSFVDTSRITVWRQGFGFLKLHMGRIPWNPKRSISFQWCICFECFPLCTTSYYFVICKLYWNITLQSKACSFWKFKWSDMSVLQIAEEVHPHTHGAWIILQIGVFFLWPSTHNIIAVCVTYYRWRCAKPLETRLKLKPGANIARSPARTMSLFPAGATAKR